MTLHYHYGQNIPGYLPMADEPNIAQSFDEARDCLLDDMRNVLDFYDMGEGIENAEMARAHGLAWMVATDHGGPNHSKVNLEMAYPELLQSRDSVPEVIQFYGMEFDPPGAEHASLIIPHSHHEHTSLYQTEKRFSRRDSFPSDPARSTEWGCPCWCAGCGRR